MSEAIKTMLSLEEEMQKKYKCRPLSKYRKKDLLRVIDSLNDISEELATNLYIATQRIEELEPKHATAN